MWVYYDTDQYIQEMAIVKMTAYQISRLFLHRFLTRIVFFTGSEESRLAKKIQSMKSMRYKSFIL